MQNTIIAVDIAKNVFEVAVSRRTGVVTELHRLVRHRFLPFMGKLKPTTVLLEACGTAHHWARQLQNLGHKPILLPAHATRPYVLRNKTDQADAKALLEASRNKDIKPVPIKSIEQQALMTLHRLRSGWMAVRTARLNAIRGHLRELGFTIPLGARLVVPSCGNFWKMPRTTFRSSSGPPWPKQGVRSASLNNASSISKGSSERCPGEAR